YITPNFELKEVTLAIKNLSYPHTGNHIQEALEMIIFDWNIKDKVFCCTMYNRKNMKKALSQITWLKGVLCMAHTIELTIGKKILPAKVLITRAKRLITFFTCPKQNKRLINVQKQYALSTNMVDESINESQLVFYHALIDCETCWSSTFNAWSCLLILKPFIDIISTAKNVNNIHLLEESQYSTVSYIYSMIQKIKARLSVFFDSSDEDNDNQDELENAFEKLQIEDNVEDEPKANQKIKIKINNLVNIVELIDMIKGKLYQAMNYYYEDLELDGLVASLLDSCWKNLSFITESKKKEAINELHQLYNEEISKNHISERQQNKLLQKKSRTKVYGESLLDSCSYDINKVDRYFALQEISKD
ncbi:22790_t:CDS:2, partial [Dentiscutata erythropus]